MAGGKTNTPREQIKDTHFVFRQHLKDPRWHMRTDVQCSLLKAAVYPQDTDTTIDRYKPFIVCTRPLRNLVTTVDNARDADDVTFENIGNDSEKELIVGILIHSDDEPIAHIGLASGLPLWTNGGDIIIIWNSDINKIYRLRKEV